MTNNKKATFKINAVYAVKNSKLGGVTEHLTVIERTVDTVTFVSDFRSVTADIEKSFDGHEICYTDGYGVYKPVVYSNLAL